MPTPLTPMPAPAPLRTTAPVITEERVHETETGDPIHAHIVKVGRGKNAAAVILEARINGLEVEALCGHRWVPSRNPGNYPVCQKCKEIYDMYKGFNEGLPDSPGEA